MLYGMQTVGAPGIHTFFVRVGVYPLFDCQKVLCYEFLRTYDDENNFLLSFVTKDC